MKEFEKEGTYVYLWLIYVYARQKPTQYCKAIIIQLKINKFYKKSTIPEKNKNRNNNYFCKPFVETPNLIINSSERPFTEIS